MSKIKKVLFFLVISLVYISQAFTSEHPFGYIYYFGFMLAVVLLYIIRSKYLSILLSLALLVAMEFYNANYKYLTVIAFLLIVAHKNLTYDMNFIPKNKISSFHFSSFCVQTSIFLTVVLFIYSLILISKNNPFSSVQRLSRTVLIMIWLIGVFLYSIYRDKNKNKQKCAIKINKNLSNKLQYMYLVSIIAFLTTVLFTYAKSNTLIMDYHTIYFPWFTYICTMIYNSDPYIESMAESIENLLNKISYKDMVKK